MGSVNIETLRAIERLRAIETERELTAGEERRLVGLLRCAKEDEGEREEATRQQRREVARFYSDLGCETGARLWS